MQNTHAPINPAPYPQHLNLTRLLNFAGRPGLQWEPSLFNQTAADSQANPADPNLKVSAAPSEYETNSLLTEEHRAQFSQFGMTMDRQLRLNWKRSTR